MKACVGVDIYIYPYFLDLGTSWRGVVSFTPRPLYPGERAPGTHWIGGSVSARVGLDDVEKRKFLILLGLELRLLSRPARSQSLYQLRYPGSPTNMMQIFIRKFSLTKRRGHFELSWLH
jgi:hypothetical protein